MKCLFKKKKKSKKVKIVERSNVIQFDVMGYPLRLCIMSDGTRIWIDTNEREGDVALEWTELEERDRH